MKYIWVIERTDSAGEFQPMITEHPHLSKESVTRRVEQLSQGKVGAPRYRAKRYVREEIR